MKSNIVQMCLVQDRHHTIPHQCNCHTRWKVPSDRLLALQMWMSATTSKFTSVPAYIQIKSIFTINHHLCSLLTTSQFPHVLYMKYILCRTKGSQEYVEKLLKSSPTTKKNIYFKIVYFIYAIFRI